MSELGPCIICGATGYSPSYGGPDICPACDCGHFNGPALAYHNAKLSAELKALRAAPASPESLGVSQDAPISSSEPDWKSLALKYEAERDEALRFVAKYAREAGEAAGRLEMSEAAGIVDGWRERCEAAEALALKYQEHLKVAVEALGNFIWQMEYLAKKLRQQPDMAFIAPSIDEAIAMIPASVLTAVRGEEEGNSSSVADIARTGPIARSDGDALPVGRGEA